MNTEVFALAMKKCSVSSSDPLHVLFSLFSYVSCEKK